MDYSGIALIIGAIGVLITTVTAAGVSIATFVMQARSNREVKAELVSVGRDVAETKENIKIVEKATNSLTDRLVASTAKESHAEGMKEERDRAEAQTKETKGD